MGASSSTVRQLPPAIAVPDNDEEYEVRTMNVPRLAGPIMPLVAWIAEQPWLGFLSARQFALSGIPRALRETSVPEAPCWSPLWPLPPKSDGDIDDEDEDDGYSPSSSSSSSRISKVLGCGGAKAVGLAGMGPAARAAAATPFFSGTPPSSSTPATAGAAPSSSPRVATATAADPDASPRRRSVAEYASAYARGEATPSGVAAAALAALRSVGGICRPPPPSSSCSDKRRSSSKNASCSSSSSSLSPRQQEQEQQEQQQPAANWFIAVDEDDVMRQAEASTARHASGKPLSPLDGVPYAIIDAVDALPYGTTAGTSFLASERPVHADAPAAAALRAAGAVLLGKCNCHEAGVGMTGLNTSWGTARNPHDLSRHAGGSSSGSAAAVAAGIAAFALGLDGGGSVRVPAALCGVAALRPTVGRTSRAGMPATAFSIATVGVVAPSVADAAVVHAVIANAGAGEEKERKKNNNKNKKNLDGNDNNDNKIYTVSSSPSSSSSSSSPSSVPRPAFSPPATTLPPLRPAPPPLKPLAGVRVGVFSRWNADVACDGAALVLRREGLGALEAAGAELVPVVIPELELCRCAQIATIAAELSAAYSAYTGTHRERRRLAAETRVSLAMAANKLRAPDFVAAARVRARLMTHFEQKVFSKCDVVAAPACGMVAPVVPSDALRGGGGGRRGGKGGGYGESDLKTAGELMRFTIPVNMSGLPAVVVPLGASPKEGMPVGMQLIGRAWDEAGLLAVAAAVEDRVRPGAMRAPATRFDLFLPAAAANAAAGAAKTATARD